MSNRSYYIWLIFLIIYIISPWDLFPAFLDDLIAAGMLLYLYLTKANRKAQQTRSSFRAHSHAGGQSFQQDAPHTNMNLEEAYRTLGVAPDSSWEEVKKAYKDRIAKSHPDKVSHLSEELQDKARELTIKLNNVLDIIKKSRKI